MEDIIDSGNTLKYLKDTYFAGKNVKSVRICTLLDKPARRTADIVPDYTGFSVEDKFIVGYGLDYQERFRPASAYHLAGGERRTAIDMISRRDRCFRFSERRFLWYGADEAPVSLNNKIPFSSGKIKEEKMGYTVPAGISNKHLRF